VVLLPHKQPFVTAHFQSLHVSCVTAHKNAVDRTVTLLTLRDLESFAWL